MSNSLTGASLDHEGAGTAAIGSIIRLISDTISGAAARIREERTRRELLKLDDRMLSDIGLTRFDIYSETITEMRRI
jgi:uncharacterized protein YjiS (DUF1127 family)